MPTSTARYRFEFQLFDWAETLTQSMTGNRTSLFIGFRSDGTLRRVYFSPPDLPLDGTRKNTLAQSYSSWFCYTPYDSEGTGYLEWLNLPEKVASRWLKRPLKETDWLDMRREDRRDGWPESWRVIIS